MTYEKIQLACPGYSVSYTHTVEVCETMIEDYGGYYL